MAHTQGPHGSPDRSHFKNLSVTTASEQDNDSAAALMALLSSPSRPGSAAPELRTDTTPSRGMAAIYQHQQQPGAHPGHQTLPQHLPPGQHHPAPGQGQIFSPGHPMPKHIQPQRATAPPGQRRVSPALSDQLLAADERLEEDGTSHQRYGQHAVQGAHAQHPGANSYVQQGPRPPHAAQPYIPHGAQQPHQQQHSQQQQQQQQQQHSQQQQQQNAAAAVHLARSTGVSVPESPSSAKGYKYRAAIPVSPAASATPNNPLAVFQYPPVTDADTKKTDEEGAALTAKLQALADKLATADGNQDEPDLSGLEARTVTELSEQVLNTEAWAFRLGVEEIRESQRGRVINVLAGAPTMTPRSAGQFPRVPPPQSATSNTSGGAAGSVGENGEGNDSDDGARRERRKRNLSSDLELASSQEIHRTGPVPLDKMQVDPVIGDGKNQQAMDVVSKEEGSNGSGTAA